MLTDVPSHSIKSSPRPNAPTPKSPSTQQNVLNPLHDASSLRTRLGLNKWKCGSLTKKGGPCSQPIPKENRVRIDTLIEAIVTSDEPCSRRPPQLDDIAILAHCIFHERMTPSDYRMANWISMFPSEDDSLVLSIEDQIMEVLGPCSARCRTANKCNNHVGGQKVRNYKRTIDEIVKPEVYLNERYLPYFLRVLEANIYCPEHENTGNKMTVYWKTEIREIAPKPKESTMVSEMERLEDKIQALTLEGGQSRQSRNMSPSNSQSSRNNTNKSSIFLNVYKSPAFFWPIEFDTTPLRIVKTQETRKSAEDLIRSEVECPLIPIVKRSGYIYLFEAENTKDLLKIGYTTRSVRERQVELSFRCNRRFAIVFPIASKTPVLIPNAYRVEALCHAELDEFRKMVYCEGCLTHHHEWFQISKDKAITVINKWSKWMTSNPYDPAGHLKRDKDLGST